MKTKKRDRITYTLLLSLVGSGLIVLALVLTPDFAIAHISKDGALSNQGFMGFQVFRISAFSLGFLSLLSAALYAVFYPKVSERLTSLEFPILTILVVLIAWGIIAAFNLSLIILDFNPGTASYFPISVFKPRFSLARVPYSLLFFILFGILFRITRKTSAEIPLQPALMWLGGLLLILVGNLAQENLEIAFLQPLQWGDSQYYHDAIKITDLFSWLKDFNVNQSSSFLASHTRTHPPFAVLIHYFLLKLWGQNPLGLSLSFTVLASLSIPLVWKIMKTLGATAQRSSQFALLFSVLPAVNIYSAVSLDSVILTFSTIFLLGMVKILKDEEVSSGILLTIIGFFLVNALTFGGIFLIMVLGLMAIRNILVEKDYRLFKTLLITVVLAAAFWGLMNYLLGYDHLHAFLTASHNENPAGFRLFSASINYTMTRIEGITEIALFASLGVLAYLLRPKYLNLKPFDLGDSVNALFFAGLLSLLLIFLAGTYKTGETARACLFIYPYFLLIFRNIDPTKLNWITLLAGAQTLAMQTLGWYLW